MSPLRLARDQKLKFLCLLTFIAYSLAWIWNNQGIVVRIELLLIQIPVSDRRVYMHRVTRPLKSFCSTTNRFPLKLYCEFTWKHGQIGLFSLWAVMFIYFRLYYRWNGFIGLRSSSLRLCRLIDLEEQLQNIPPLLFLRT